MIQPMAIDYFATVKRYYDSGIYDNADVAVFVEMNKITASQYEQITGVPYGEAI